MATLKQFKAESKKLLDLVIHSIYTNQEIFLRELISNASDATDKLISQLADNPSMTFNKDEMTIELRVNKDLRTLSIIDRGIGMDDKDLETNLGTIAHSGTQAFQEALSKEDAASVDLIGQFGVGFYSAFMVAKEVRVLTKKVGSDQAYAFISDGVEGYKIEKIDKADHGTEVILFLRDQDENYPTDQYLEEGRLKGLVKKYSDYIRYPIQMMDDQGQLETLNSMIPLWKKNKNEVTQEETDQFYMDHFHDFEKPAHTIHLNVEGSVSFSALLFIPSHPPFNFYSTDYQKGLDLYSQGVFILDNNKNLIADYFGFVKGVVDSNDLSLNISRELLQNNRQLDQMAHRINRKVKSELANLLEKDRPAYETFYKNFGHALKYGVYQNFGQDKKVLEDLLLFYSTKEDGLVTLKEYVDRKKDDQKEIYYISSNSIAQAKTLPAVESLLDQDLEVLVLTDQIDEFVLTMLHDYQEMSFKAANQGEASLAEDKQKEIDALNKDHQALLDKILSNVKNEVQGVRISARLKNQPVCLVSQEGLSMEMEKVLAQNPDASTHLKAQKVLEINYDHPLFKVLETADDQTLALYSRVLYNQAALIEGLSINDPVQFSKDLAQLMVHSS